MKFLSFLLLATLLSGCALAPGMYLEESGIAVEEETAEPQDAAAVRPVIIPISAGLIANAAQKRMKPADLGQTPGVTAADYRYIVGPGDILTITVWEHPELTIPAGEYRNPADAGYVVAADGTIFFPYVGVYPAGGKPLAVIRDELTRHLTAYIQKPQLDVKVAAFRSQKVYITGEVAKPGVHPITDVPMMLLDCINGAGGQTPEADLRNVLITRNGKTHPIDLQALYDSGDLTQNWLMQHGDQIHIPDRNQNKVFILGEVKKPAARLMHKGRMTLAEAIGDAEGVDPLTSDPSRIYVIRGGFARPKIYKLDARSADALLLATQFELEPQDVVYVSAADVSRWNRVISQILPTVQTLWQTKAITD